MTDPIEKAYKQILMILIRGFNLKIIFLKIKKTLLVNIYCMKKIVLNILRNSFPKLFLFLKYQYLKRKPSDINEHLQTLSNYASSCNSIFETGVRGVVSSWALLYGISKNNQENKTFIMNDIDEINTFSIITIMNKLNINGEFIKGNNLDLNLSKNFDLVFIDTLHVYGQLKRELQKFSKIATKYIILHDTTVDADKGEVIRLGLDINTIIKQTKFDKTEIVKGLWPAVEEFLNNNEDWFLSKRYINNNGLTILEKSVIK
jgi:hypothetical protein